MVGQWFLSRTDFIRETFHICLRNGIESNDDLSRERRREVLLSEKGETMVLGSFKMEQTGVIPKTRITRLRKLLKIHVNAHRIYVNIIR